MKTYPFSSFISFLESNLETKFDFSNSRCNNGKQPCALTAFFLSQNPATKGSIVCTTQSVTDSNLIEVLEWPDKLPRILTLSPNPGVLTTGQEILNAIHAHGL